MLKRLPELQKQLVKFTLIGGLAVLTDLAVYYAMLNLLPAVQGSYITTEVVSKTLSFLCGTFVTYNLNKFWTWRRKDSSNRRLFKFFVLYGTSLLLNVAVNSIGLATLHSDWFPISLPRKYVFAFLAATGASAVFNFLGQKLWVFSVRKHHRDST